MSIKRISNNKSQSFKKKLTLLNSDNISLEQLEELSNDEDYAIRSYVAEHKNCSLELLEKLSNDKDSCVRKWVAVNNNCPDYILVRLYKEFSYFIVHHPNCPDYLKVLSK